MVPLATRGAGMPEGRTAAIGGDGGTGIIRRQIALPLGVGGRGMRRMELIIPTSPSLLEQRRPSQPLEIGGFQQQSTTVTTPPPPVCPPPPLHSSMGADAFGAGGSCLLHLLCGWHLSPRLRTLWLVEGV
jgi:hypothetical protein